MNLSHIENSKQFLNNIGTIIEKGERSQNRKMFPAEPWGIKSFRAPAEFNHCD